ncbi:MAG: WecB/TagA/CpsF family glycosyltransferase [Patescibacteria group bacterium]
MLKIFNLPIDDISLDQTLKKIDELVNSQGQQLIVTANPEILLYAKKHHDYFDILNQASLRVPDGFGIKFISYIIGKPLYSGLVRGVDLVDQLLQNSNYSFLITGGSSEVLDKIKQKYTQTNINYLVGPFFNDNDQFPLSSNDNDRLINEINKHQPQVLLVGFGAPKQEKWISYYLKQIPSVKVAIGVGGSFDYLSGQVSRAPKNIQKLGLEWLWRVIKQPKRIFRIINAVIIFPLLAILNEMANTPTRKTGQG